jgi:hypothetical protein
LPSQLENECAVEIEKFILIESELNKQKDEENRRLANEMKLRN